MIKGKSQNSAEGKRAQVISRIHSHHQKHNIFFKTPGPLMYWAELWFLCTRHTYNYNYTYETTMISLRRFCLRTIWQWWSKICLRLASSCFWNSIASKITFTCVEIHIQFLVIYMLSVRKNGREREREREWESLSKYCKRKT